MSEEKPRRIPRLFSCLIKGPLGCLAFLVGASVVLVLFLPPAAGRFTDRMVESWFSERFQGSLELSDAWLGSLYGPQEIDGLILRDPDGDEVLRASLRAPALSLAFSHDEYGPIEVHVNVLRLAQEPDGSASLVRAFDERTEGGGDAPRPPREPRSGLQTDVPMRVPLQVTLDRLRYSDARGAEGALDNLRFDGQLEWTPELARIVLRGGSDPLVPEPLTVALELVRPERGPEPRWTVTWSFERVPSVLAAVVAGSAAALEPFAGPYVDLVSGTSAPGLVELTLEDEGARVALRGQRGDGHVYSNLPGQALELELPVREPWLARVLLPLLPAVVELEPDPDLGPALLHLEPYRIDLAGDVPRATGELALEVGFRGYALAPPILQRLAAPLVPTSGAVQQHVTLEDARAVFSSLWLPCERGRLELAGALDLEDGAYDLDVTVQGPGDASQELRLEGSRDALVPAEPGMPVPPFPPEPHPGG